MISSSESWMSESQSWLAAPRTYATSKCLSEHAGALQVSASRQIRPPPPPPPTMSLHLSPFLRRDVTDGAERRRADPKDLGGFLFGPGANVGGGGGLGSRGAAGGSRPATGGRSERLGRTFGSTPARCRRESSSDG